MRRNEYIGLSVAVVALVLGFIIFHLYGVLELSGKIDTAQVIEIIILFTLVLVTVIYAKRTSEIADATKEQLLGEARPYLLLRLEDDFVQWDNIEPDKRPPTKFKVTIRNVGKGPAINLWAALWSPKKIYFGDSKGYLAPGEEWQTNISRLSTGGVEMGIKKEGWLPKLGDIVKQQYPGIVAVKYNDIHQRIWVSYLYLERHVDVESYVMEAEQNIVELKNND